jgi:hypothetical protein
MDGGTTHTRRRIVLAVLAALQLALAGAAWTDLARRPARLVRGPKWIWALVIAVNFIGPLWYFRWGRLPAPDPGEVAALDAAATHATPTEPEVPGARVAAPVPE